MPSDVFGQRSIDGYDSFYAYSDYDGPIGYIQAQADQHTVQHAHIQRTHSNNMMNTQDARY